jgi:carboxypeptidase Q
MYAPPCHQPLHHHGCRTRLGPVPTALFAGALTCFLAGTTVLGASAAPSAATMQRIVAAALTDTYAYERLGELCDVVGPRLAGSPAMARAIAWAAATMERDGFDAVWTEPVVLSYWERGEERAEVTGPTAWTLTLSGLGNSVGTPPDGIEAKVLAVRDWDELEMRATEAAGCIVLFDPPWEGYGKTVQYRTRGASTAASHGAVACLIRSVTDCSLGAPHTGMMSYADSLPRIPAAAITVEDAGRLHRLCQRGLTPRVHLVMTEHRHDGVTSHNVIGEIRGREKPDEIVLLGGHLDSWDVGTGAHDDGAGCIITLAAARLLAHLDLRPRRTLRVVLFESEEFGGFGGEAYAKAHADELARHVAALESDSGAFPPRGFSVRADSLVIAYLQELAAPLAEIGADQVETGWAGVDIGPSVEQGIPGIGHRTRSDDYFHYHHSPADTFDKIDPEALAQNVAAVAALIWAVAEDPVSLRDRAPACP